MLGDHGAVTYVSSDGFQLHVGDMDQVKTLENDIASMTHPRRMQDALQLVSDPASIITQAPSTPGENIEEIERQPRSIRSNIPALHPITTTPATSRVDGNISTSSFSVGSAMQRVTGPTDAAQYITTPEIRPRKKRRRKIANPIEARQSEQGQLQGQSSPEEGGDSA